MWAGRSTTSRTRANSSPLSRSPSWTMMRVFVTFCCTFLVVVDIELVTSMSLDRFGIERNNELLSDKKKDMNDNNKSAFVVEDLELEAIPAGGETEMYLLLPAGGKSERESVDKNIIESDRPEPTNVAEVGSDMLMMESNDTPVVHVANLTPSEMVGQMGKEKKDPKTDSVKVDDKKDIEDEPSTSDENDDEPIKQVFKNDKDIEDMAFENDSDKAKDSGEDAETGDGKDESGEESESMVEMFADVVEEVEKEIETELVGEETDIAANKVVHTKDEEKDKWEATVEKLEEKGSEKNKVNENDIQLATAAVMEEILPEEVVEAMALTEENDSSSEEKNEDEIDKKKTQNQITKKESTQQAEKETSLDKEQFNGIKKESEENHTKGSNEDLKKEEDNNLEANIETELTKLEDMNMVENIETEALKDEQINQPTKDVESVSVMSEGDNKEQNGNTSSKTEEFTKTEKPLDSVKEPIQSEHQILNHNEKEKEETNKENKNKEVVQEHIHNDIETTKENESETAEKISHETVGTIQTEVAEKDENNKHIEDTLIPFDSDQENKHETTLILTEPSKPVLIEPAQEKPLPIPIDIETNGNNKGEEMETIENTINQMVPMEVMNGESETVHSIKPIQIEELVNFYEENENTEDNDKTSINLDGTLNQPIESYYFPQMTQNSEEQTSKETMPTAETTLLTTILHMPALQQPQQQQLQQLQQDEHKVNLQQEVVATTQMTIESSTSKPQIVISATQDTVLGYVNATNEIHTLSGEREQQKQQLLYATESDNETSFNSQLRRYDGAQVWRIVVQNDRDRRLADELQSKYDGQLWKEVKQEVDYLLKPQVLAAAEKHIRAANLSRIVLIDNLQQVIEVENPPLDEFADADNEKGHRLTWHAYHRLADIHEFYDYLAKTYPEICSVETIGYSIERRPLKVLKISNGNAGNPGVWIDGGMHAREWISPASVTYIANQLAEGWEDLPSHLKNVNWYIHAVANPDGYEYTHTIDRLWRKNMRSHGRQCPGVDLNRNFGFKWGGKGTSANPCSQIYRGTKAFSEPETFYISKFISGFPRDTFQAFLSFHSYGQYILYPWGYDYALTNDRSDLDRVARAAATTITRSSGSKYTVGPSAVTLYPASGGSDDWAKGIANIKYTYTIEMGDNGRYGFILPASLIETNGKDAYTFVQTVARAISHDVRKRTIKLK